MPQLYHIFSRITLQNVLHTNIHFLSLPLNNCVIKHPLWHEQQTILTIYLTLHIILAENCHFVVFICLDFSVEFNTVNHYNLMRVSYFDVGAAVLSFVIFTSLSPCTVLVTQNSDLTLIFYHSKVVFSHRMVSPLALIGTHILMIFKTLFLG